MVISIKSKLSSFSPEPMFNDFLFNGFGFEFIFLLRNYISNFGVILIPQIYIAYKLIDLFVCMRNGERERGIIFASII